MFAAAAMILASHGAAVAGYSEGGAFKVSGYGARAWGMGGAAIVTVDDESAVYWNPGMMALVPSNSVGASYINLVAGATAHQSQLAYVHALQVSKPDEYGKTVARHAVGALYTNVLLGIQGGEDYDENIFRLAYAYTPDYFVSFAIAWDIFASTSTVGGFKSKGTSVDGAVRLMLTENLTVGLVARNAFSRYSYYDGTDFRREREFVLGMATGAVPFVTVEGDVVMAHGGVSRLVAGAETDYLFDVLALRAGISMINTGESRTVPYFGFGARVSRLAVHYNATLDQENAFADTHRFTLSFSL